MDTNAILDGLNAAQRSAVTSPAAVLQILAPPGSGKTKTLTSRVAYLLSHHGYKPWNTLCLTFTIKSAKEMKERIVKLIGRDCGSRIILGTFHSVCRRYLVSYGHLINIYKGFGIIDSSDSAAIVNRIVKRLKLTINPKAARSRISSSKAKGVGYADIKSSSAKKMNVDQQEFAMVFEAYEAHLATSNLLDYDDLLLRCVDLLQHHPACVSNVEAVLIDEFQDTNNVQFDLMSLFAARHKRITTVGDPDQSIYGWRSAEIKNLKRMQKQYPDTLIVHLQDNYRSAGAILLAALEVIQQDVSRPPKPLLPTHCPGTVPVLRRIPSAAIEASWIVSEIARCKGLSGELLTYTDCAILLRSASLSRHIESALGKSGIPYRMVGGRRFFDRIEIKILLDYLRVVHQPENSDALARILNTPSRRVGDLAIKTMLEEAAERHITLWTLIRDVTQGNMRIKTRITKTAEQGLGSVISLIVNAKQKMQNPENHYEPKQLLEFLIKKLDFKSYLEKTHPEDYEARWANVDELMSQAASYSPDGSELSSSDDDEMLPNIEGISQSFTYGAGELLSKFLANIALSTELQQDESLTEDGRPQDYVTISTIHSAKGLEWPIVFIPSAYEGSIPHSRAEDIDEERRLLYVAMTRAQALLYISCPVRNSTREETTLSQFLSEGHVASYLTNQGPPLQIGTIIDIARILRRDCPSPLQLLNARKEVENVEDSIWPLNGDDRPEIVEAKWRERKSIDVEERTTPNSIYLAENLLHVQRRADRPLMHRFESAVDSTCSTMTTQNHASYTTVGHSSGFISASSHFINIKSENARQSSDRGPMLAKGKDSELSSSTAAKSRRTKGQETLARYWGPRNVDSEVIMADRPQLVTDQQKRKTNGNLDEATEASRNHWQDTIESSSNLAPLSNMPTLPQCTLRNPLSTIPQSLQRHSLRPSSYSVLLKRAPTAEAHGSRPYVFLSSSPPPMQSQDDKDLQVPEGIGKRPHEESVDGEVHKVSRTGDYNGMRPSSTYHRTSVAEAQCKPTVPRKTLGIRRSMVGWDILGTKYT